MWNCCCPLFCPNIHYVGCKHTFTAHSRCLWFASFDKYILKQEGPYLWRPIAPHNVTSSHSRCKKPQLTLYSTCRGVLYILSGVQAVLYILEGGSLWGHSAFSTSAAPLMTKSHDKTKAASLCFFCAMTVKKNLSHIIFNWNIARIANAVQVTICLLVSTSVY